MSLRKTPVVSKCIVGLGLLHRLLPHLFLQKKECFCIVPKNFLFVKKKNPVFILKVQILRKGLFFVKCARYARTRCIKQEGDNIQRWIPCCFSQIFITHLWGMILDNTWVALTYRPYTDISFPFSASDNAFRATASGSTIP